MASRSRRASALAPGDPRLPASRRGSVAASSDAHAAAAAAAAVPPVPSSSLDGEAASTGEQAHDFTDGGSSSITVLVRVRPLSAREVAEDTRSILRVMGQKMVVMMAPSIQQNDYLRQGRQSDKRFAFDSAWDSDTSQSTIYAHSTKNLLNGVVQGFNATCFAYGATGSGKTHSMMGSRSDPGIMVLTLVDLFKRIEEVQAERVYKYTVSLSLLEIYNEHIRDLLSPHLHSSSAGGGGVASADSHSPPASSSPDLAHVNPNSLDLREDPLRGMVVAGITERHGISSSAQILALLEQGNKQRTTEPTKANQVSSRSHSVLQIIVERHEVTPGLVADIKVAKLNLIDLAGSERASKTENRGIRLTEGANINRSLLALANVINSLANQQQQQGSGSGGNGGSSDGGTFTNWRDSQLTRLLKDSLSGKTKTVMICCVSPAENSYEETFNTLKYADRAKGIKTRVESNEKSVQMQVHQYQSVIGALRAEVALLKRELWDAHQGTGPGMSPITSNPQYRLSSIPSVARGSAIGSSPVRSSLRVGVSPKSPSGAVQFPEILGPSSGAGDDTWPSSAAAAAGSEPNAHQRSKSAKMLLQQQAMGSPSRMVQPAHFFSDVPGSESIAMQQQQQQMQQQLIRAAQQQQQHQRHSRNHRSPTKARRSRYTGFDAYAQQQQQQQSSYLPAVRGSYPGAFGDGGGGGGNHKSKRLSHRDKMELYLSLPEREQEDVTAAFAYLQQPRVQLDPDTERSGSAGGDSAHDGLSAGAMASSFSAAAASVMLPPSLEPTLAGWPFDLLRRLQTKTWNEVLAVRERLLGEVLRPELALRTRWRKKKEKARLIEEAAAAVQAREAAHRAAMTAGHVTSDDLLSDSASADAATVQSPLPAALRSELESISERLHKLASVSSKVRSKVAFKSALAALIHRLLSERIEQGRPVRGNAAAGRFPHDAPSHLYEQQSGRDEDAVPHNARQMLHIEHRSFQASLGKLLTAETELRNKLALLATRSRVQHLESLLGVQGALLDRELLPRLEGEPERVKEVEHVAAQVAELMAGSAHLNIATGGETERVLEGSAGAGLSIAVSASVAHAAIRFGAQNIGGGGGQTLSPLQQRGAMGGAKTAWSSSSKSNARQESVSPSRRPRRGTDQRYLSPLASPTSSNGDAARMRNLPSLSGSRSNSQSRRNTDGARGVVAAASRGGVDATPPSRRHAGLPRDLPSLQPSRSAIVLPPHLHVTDVSSNGNSAPPTSRHAVEVDRAAKQASLDAAFGALGVQHREPARNESTLAAHTPSAALSVSVHSPGSALAAALAEEEARAVTKIAAVQRGRMVRQNKDAAFAQLRERKAAAEAERQARAAVAISAPSPVVAAVAPARTEPSAEEQAAAATKIAALQRGRMVRQNKDETFARLRERKAASDAEREAKAAAGASIAPAKPAASPEEQARAVTKIAAVQRGRMVRQNKDESFARLRERKAAADAERQAKAAGIAPASAARSAATPEEQAKAATKIAALQRGRLVRKNKDALFAEMLERKTAAALDRAARDASSAAGAPDLSPELEAEVRERAAVKIQALARGRAVRKEKDAAFARLRERKAAAAAARSPGTANAAENTAPAGDGGEEQGEAAEEEEEEDEATKAAYAAAYAAALAEAMEAAENDEGEEQQEGEAAAE